MLLHIDAANTRECCIDLEDGLKVLSVLSEGDLLFVHASEQMMSPTWLIQLITVVDRLQRPLQILYIGY